MLSLSALLNALAHSSPILFSALSLTFRVVSLFGIALLFLPTCQVQFCQCCVCLQCFAQRTCSFTIDLVACLKLWLVSYFGLVLRLLLLLRTCQSHCHQFCVDFQCLSQCTCSITDPVPCFLLLFLFLCPHFALSCCTQPRLSAVSFVLTFNASPSARAPSSSISLPVLSLLWILSYYIVLLMMHTP